MAKKILLISTDIFGEIKQGNSLQLVISDKVENFTVKEIKYQCGACGEDYYQESYYIHFEDSPKTLEVFDVNYVIRDEE